MHRAFIALVAVVFGAAAIPVLADQTMPTSLTVPIAAQNNSGQTGVATLTATSDNKTKVDIALNGEPSGASEPAHIHPGPCKTLNPAPKYPLNPIVDGKSSTVVDVPLSAIASNGMAINVHESKTAIANYVACGNIFSAAAAPAGGPSTPGMAASPGY